MPVSLTLDEFRARCLAFPEATERKSHGHPAFFVRVRHQFASYHAVGDGTPRPCIWMPALPGVQRQLVNENPDRYFAPAYVGPSGWIGIYLDRPLDSDALSDLLDQSYRMRAPQMCVKQLDAR